MLLLVNPSATTGASMTCFKPAFVCVAIIAITGCKDGSPTAKFQIKPKTETEEQIETLERKRPKDADAYLELAALYASKEGASLHDELKGSTYLKKAANQGHAEAQNILGYLYDSGTRTIKQDHSKAVELYRLSALQGYSAAQLNLGISYATGQGVARDYRAASKWYRLAAEQGESQAQWHLGYLYSKGDGVPRDFVEAYAWFSVAAAGGWEDAVTDREVAANQITPEQLAEGKKRATELIAKYGSEQ